MASGPILIVDDEPTNLDLMRQVLSSAYELVFAINGEQAIAAAPKHRPSLILLDIQLPDRDGYSVCRELKSDARTSDIPVIFFTGLTDSGHEEQGFAVGAVDYIGKPISPAVARARVRTHLALVKASRLEQSYRDSILMLGQAGHFNDTDTGVHIWRMAAYSRVLALGAGWSEADANLLELAAPMHDTGKIGIPSNILRKPGPLDAQEWEVMRTHSQIGHDILSRSQAPAFQLAAEVSLRHHERWDGSGYPGGLKGTDIPQSARIVALADVFDALSMKRPYKESWPIEKIRPHIVANAGSHFDPELVSVFEQVLPKLLAVQEHWRVAEDGMSRSPEYEVSTSTW
jgi:putative two-component system response regulator